MNLVEFEEFTSIATNFFNTIGMKGFYTNKSDYFKFRQKNLLFLGAFNLIFSLICEIIEVLMILKNLKNLHEFLLATAITACSGFVALSLVKLYTVYLNIDRMTNVMYQLKLLFPTTKMEQKHMDVTKYAKNVKYLMKLFAALYMFLIWTFNLTPIVDTTIRYLKTGVFTKVLPYFSYYPLIDPFGKKLYPITHILQIWAGYFSATSTLASDLLLCSTVGQLAMHFDYLAKCIGELKPHEQSINTIKDFVKRHLIVIKISEDVNSMFQSAILINFVSSCAIICLVGFQSSVDMRPIPIFKFSLFLVSSLIQIGMICWYGEKLMNSSESICSGVFQSNWMYSNIKYKKSMLLIMMRSRRFQALSALQFFKVSLKSFNKVLSTAYSFFTLLRTMYNRS